MVATITPHVLGTVKNSSGVLQSSVRRIERAMFLQAVERTTSLIIFVVIYNGLKLLSSKKHQWLNDHKPGQNQLNSKETSASKWRCMHVWSHQWLWRWVLSMQGKMQIHLSEPKSTACAISKVLSPLSESAVRGVRFRRGEPNKRSMQSSGRGWGQYHTWPHPTQVIRLDRINIRKATWQLHGAEEMATPFLSSKVFGANSPTSELRKSQQCCSAGSWGMAQKLGAQTQLIDLRMRSSRSLWSSIEGMTLGKESLMERLHSGRWQSKAVKPWKWTSTAS